MAISFFLRTAFLFEVAGINLSLLKWPLRMIGVPGLIDAHHCLLLLVIGICTQFWVFRKAAFHFISHGSLWISGMGFQSLCKFVRYSKGGHQLTWTVACIYLKGWFDYFYDIQFALIYDNLYYHKRFCIGVDSTILVPNSVAIHIYRLTSVSSMCKSSSPGGNWNIDTSSKFTPGHSPLNDVGARTTCKWLSAIGP